MYGRVETLDNFQPHFAWLSLMTKRPCMLQGMTWQATTSLDHSASTPDKFPPSQSHNEQHLQ